MGKWFEGASYLVPTWTWTWTFHIIDLEPNTPRTLRRAHPHPRQLHRAPTLSRSPQGSQKGTQNRTHLRLPTHYNLQRPSKLEHPQAPRPLLLLRTPNAKRQLPTRPTHRQGLPSRHYRWRRHIPLLRLHPHALEMDSRCPCEHCLDTPRSDTSSAAHPRARRPQGGCKSRDRGPAH